MNDGASPFARTPLYFCGLGACTVGGVMLAIQIGGLLAVVCGVQDNQGTIYVFTVPVVTYAIGLPIAIVLTLLAFLGRGNRKVATVGLFLTFSGPLMLVVVIGIGAVWALVSQR